MELRVINKAKYPLKKNHKSNISFDGVLSNANEMDQIDGLA